MLLRILLLSLLAGRTPAEVLFKPQNVFESLSGPGPSFALDLSNFTNNRAFGIEPGDADFDGSKGSYPVQHIPPPSFTYNGFNFNFSSYEEGVNDNVLAKGQEIPVPPGKYFAVSMLAASDSDMAEGSIDATYGDGRTHSNPLLVPAWWTWPYPAGGDLIFPFYYSEESIDYNRSNIYQTVNWLDTSNDIVSLTLPSSDDGESGIHIFSLSLWPAMEASEGNGPTLEVQYARSTNKWLPETDKIQIVEVLVSNVGSSGWILTNNTVTVSVVSDGLETVQLGVVKRLRPGDQAIVEVGVVNTDGVEAGETGEATVVLKGVGVDASYSFNATYGIVEYDPTYESIYAHEAPSWYNGAKFGIFIHWGVYAVPAWGNSGDNEAYAEWYWWNMNSGPDTKDETYQYHLETYGSDVVYDDFIQNFTASEFDPKEWVDLFADAGANYFVLTSKHHDGYALMDLPEDVTKRTSVAQFPHRDFVRELFDASKVHQPHLHRATYFSLPEWFHPGYQEYGFGSWPGGSATNPYTDEKLDYAGYVPVDDFIADVIIPEMNVLAELGTEIMWCDIGGPNMTTDFAASWYNKAAAEGRQVVMNARCGLPGDFDTPEYTTYAGIQRRKWETSRGMDPFSYGYNSATPISEYMNASTIVTSLVDIASKNGNFLLDIGPKADGTILEVEKLHLRDAGAWIKDHAEAIFDTSYWFVESSEGENIRFTTTLDAFYISVLSEPEYNVITLKSPVPWIDGDDVVIVGGNMAGEVVPSRQLEDGSIELEVSDDVVAADQWVWVFKIPYE